MKSFKLIAKLSAFFLFTTAAFAYQAPATPEKNTLQVPQDTVVVEICADFPRCNMDPPVKK